MKRGDNRTDFLNNRLNPQAAIGMKPDDEGAKLTGVMILIFWFVNLVFSFRQECIKSLPE